MTRLQLDLELDSPTCIVFVEKPLHDVVGHFDLELGPKSDMRAPFFVDALMGVSFSQVK